MSNITNTFNYLLNCFFSRYIIYTKILQWINFDCINFLGTDFNKFIRKFTDNAPYIDDDINYKSIQKLKNLGEKYNIEINKIPINSGTVSLVFEGYIVKDDQKIKIAIKILRNNVKDKIISTISTIKYFINILNFFNYFEKLNLMKIINDIEECLIEQVDFEKERNSIKLFDTKLKKYRGIKTIKLIDELCFDDVITMEFIEGKSVYKLNEQEKENYCKLLISSTFYIQLKKGLYHMDLHPGNILYIDDSTLCFLDLGMIETLSANESNFMIDYFELISSESDIKNLFTMLIDNYKDLILEPGNFNRKFIDIIFERYPDIYKVKSIINQVQDTQKFLSNLHLTECQVNKRVNRLLFGFLSFLNLFTAFDLRIQQLVLEKVKTYKNI